MRLSFQNLLKSLGAGSIGLMVAAAAVAQPKSEPPVKESPAKTSEGDPGERKAEVKQPATKSKPTANDDSSGTISGKKKEPINPKRLRVFLMDGSVIAGEFSVSEITVTTEFGKLTVPVTKIVSITPGLGSHTKLADKIDKLLKDLGGPDYKARETAQKELVALGPPVREIVAEHTDSKNAELSRRAKEIVEKLNALAGDGDDYFTEESDKNKAWVKHDIVVTPDFTIAGKISPSVFQVSSKYGPLKVSLNDIKRTEKERTEREAIVKRLDVPGQKLIQRGMQNSRIRVKPGDTVSVVATGTISMPPFGSTARTGPEGNSRYSYYYANVDGRRTKLYGGTLVARIGSSGDFVRIGSRKKFRVKKAGTLYFGVAMNNSYIRSNYVFAGNYKLRIKVDPKE